MTASEWDWTLRVFDHVQLNTSDYTASVRFYETVLSPLGIPKIEEHEQGTWSSAWTDFTDVNVVDRRPPTTSLHLCFYARTKEQVDAFHRAGVEAGFRSNGAPGCLERPDADQYAATSARRSAVDHRAGGLDPGRLQRRARRGRRHVRSP